MKCQRCAKPVAYHVTDILDDGGVEDHVFCIDCAKKFLFSSPVTVTAKKSKKDEPEFGGQSEPVPIGERSCPDCGMKFVEFRNGGRLGCPHDYDAFQEDLLPLLEGVHSSTKHDGKKPKHRSGGKQNHNELTGLRKKLQKAIDGEKYEEAAKLRDRIKNLEAT
jgi:protein arginine kinase activator